jgi:hypothetical protein
LVVENANLPAWRYRRVDKIIKRSRPRINIAEDAGSH